MHLILEILVELFVFTLGTICLLIVAAYIVDKTQRRHAIRRNFPVIGRFRDIFEHLGIFFRAYFFAMDREELPFNRAERTWVYRAAKNRDNTVAFGSTRDLRPPGTVIFVNTTYPTLDEDAAPTEPRIIGPYVRYPYTAQSIFHISAMSYGAISTPAIRALSNGARQAGVWLNTGEGGLTQQHLDGGADIVFQIGTAKYGVRDAKGQLSEERLLELGSHDSLKMFEIKLSQGAKPGKGGILPAPKVTPDVAKVRGIEVGKDSISPNRHPEIESERDLLDLIERIRSITQKPVGFKSVIGTTDWLEAMALEIHRRGIESAPDFITVDSAEGGTGAAPMSLIDNMGLPIHESLPKVVDLLHQYDLHERIRIVASGKLVTPVNVAWALCAGADFVASARGFMFALGCIQALQCNRNTCPTGITTHDKSLQKGLDVTDKTERVKHYALNMRHEVGVIAHACGVREPRSLRRNHCRIVQYSGLSVPLNELHPDVVPGTLAKMRS